METKTSDLLALAGADAERAWRLAHGLDLKLEECQARGDSAAQTIDAVAPWLLEQIGARGLALRLLDRTADGQLLCFGADRPELEALLAAGRLGELADGTRCVVPLVLHEETFGYLAATFSAPPPSPGAAVLLEIAIEELDNVLYEFRRARFRHDQVIEVERRLQQHVLDHAIDETAGYVIAETGVSSLVVAYLEDTGESPRKRCRVYGRAGLVGQAASGESTPLAALLADGREPTPDEVLAAAELPAESIGATHIETSLSEHRSHGFLVASGPERSVTGAELELLQHFALALGQRLVDYHKDQRYLQQFFAPDVVTRLLSVCDYQATYLTPRLRQVALLYTDITSFTKISEQVLDGPDEVGELIDYWSAGVVEILFEHGGVFDKMVGDCVIGIFGTPFDDRSPAECVADALAAAWRICDYTARLAGIPVVDKIRASALVPGLGVATGVHFGKSMVGTFGPNHAFTAFGREMNNTARLQGVAGFREILVMEAARQVLEGAEHPLAASVDWGPVKEATVKNVLEPLRFHAFAWKPEGAGF